MQPSHSADIVRAHSSNPTEPSGAFARRHVSRAIMLGFLAVAGQAAHAAVLDFDDLALNQSGVINVPTPYHGILWGTLGDTDLYAWGDISYSAANSYGNSYNSPSGGNAASNYAGPVYASLSSGGVFDFNGAYFSSYTLYDVLQSDSATVLTLEGLNGATVVDSLTVNLNIGYDWIQADFLGITSLRLTSSNGIIEPERTRWMIDDFTFNATPSAHVPEPATLALSLTGLAWLTSWRRRRPQA
jgi:hypothetical protein